MFNRVLPVLSLSLLAACAADATQGEPTSSSTSALSVIGPHAETAASVTVQSIVATDTTLTFTTASTGVTDLTVVLTGPAGSTTLTNQTSTSLFVRLSNCTAYTYAFESNGATLASGQVNTHYTGNVACPSVESLTATSGEYFEGYEHSGNGSTYGNYPQGSTWNLESSTPGAQQVQVGYVHYSGGGESFVQVWRQELIFAIPPAVYARGVTNATLAASLMGEQGSNCFSGVKELGQEPWPQNEDGSLWAPLVGFPEGNVGLDYGGTAPVYPRTISGTTKGSLLTVNFGVPLTTIYAGFESDNDGFINQNPAYGGPTSYANDNNVCMQSFQNVTMNLTLADLPPDTPINCTETVNCDAYTITCQNTPDSFTLYRLPNSEWPLSPMVTVQGTTAGGTVTMNDNAGGATYQVCAKTTPGDAASACVYPTITSNVACPPPPPPPPPPVALPPPPKKIGNVQD